MYRNFADLQDSFSDEAPKTLVVAAANDEHTLEAVADAKKAMPMDYILVGKREKIVTISQKLNLELDESKIIDSLDDAESAKIAVQCVRDGKANALMKGVLETSILLKAVLNRETGIRGSGTMSHCAILEVPAYHKLIGVTDCAMIPYPTLEQKIDMVKNAVKFYHAIGIDNPKISALAASETPTDKMPETNDAVILQEMCEKGNLGNCTLEGPLSFDLSVSKESAEIKGHTSKITGEVDLFLVPNIACGNVFTKGLLYWAGAKMSGCVLGAQVPIVLVSRGASTEEKLFSIMLCLKAGD